MDTRAAIKKIPQSPGVYLYKDKDGTVIYVGKGVNLKKRVSQYFNRDDAATEKTQMLVSQIDSIETIPTMNEFDALLLEAKLIREYLPKYNVISRDDKSPLYIVITLDETLPHIFFERKTALQQYLQEDLLQKASQQNIFGPFPSARVARDLMRSLRHIIPYCTQKQRNGKPCFYTHLGLCSPCPSVISNMTPEEKRIKTHEYRTQIFRLRDILMGKGMQITNIMKKEMKDAAKNQEFEKATVLRNHLQSLHDLLQKHYAPTRYLEGQGAEDIFAKENAELIRALSSVYPNLSSLDRVECIDISNLGGKQAVGSLVVLVRGQPDVSQYRKFKIRLPNKPNDVAMIAEVLARRLKHPEWPYPNLLVIDGGKGQVGSALQVLKAHNIDIPVIGLAKRREEIIAPTFKGTSLQGVYSTIRLPLTSPGLHLLARIRDEAHRFAITYHRLLRDKQNLI